jgi:hypothetical protein
MNLPTYKLFIDDDAKTPGMESFRYPPDDSWKIALSAQEAIDIVKLNGLPSEIDFDHDLGDSNVMEFLRWISLTDLILQNPPKYKIHSRNPEGAKNIHSFMESWKKSLDT